METNKKHKNILAFIILMIIICIGGLTYNHIKNCTIKKNIQHAVAMPVKYSGGRMDNTIKIKFYYDNKIYETETLYYGLKPELGKKYFIAFNKENIEQSVLFSNCPVPDSFEVIPYGWDKITNDD